MPTTTYYRVNPDNGDCVHVTENTQVFHGLREKLAQIVLPEPQAMPKIGRWAGILMPDFSQFWATPLDTVLLNTKWWPNADGSVSPSFGTGAAMALEWKPDECHRHYLGFHKRTGALPVPYMWVHCSSPDMSGTFLPNLPNVYDDGKLCIGDGLRDIDRDCDLTVMVSELMDLFSCSTWNTDLTPRFDFSLMRWDADGKQLPMDPRVYEGYLRRFSNKFVNDWSKSWNQL